MSAIDPVLRLYRLFEPARLPQRADRAAGGTLPTRAFRFCEAVTSAAAFGWYVFPPMGFELYWDGTDIFVACDGIEDWIRLDSLQLPGMADRFDAAAPEAMAGYAPPFLTAMPEPGIVQLWTGLLARTAPGWSLHVRAPANFPLPGGYAPYEGIVETDRWFGPLFTNLRLTRTGVPIAFDPDLPLLQVQALPRTALDDAVQNAVSIAETPAELAAGDWEDYARSIIVPAADPDRRIGRYAADARRRARSCPFAG